VIRADLSSALADAVRAAVTAGEIEVTVPDRIPLTWGDGVARTPLALMLDCDPVRVAGWLAEDDRVRDVQVAPGGQLVITPEPSAALRWVAELADDSPFQGAGWADRPRTFDNPGFRVRFAYVRAAATLRWAQELGVTHGEPDTLDTPEERRLIGLLAELEDRADQAVRKQDPGKLRKHLERTADAYHDVHERRSALPSGDQEPTKKHRARVTLAQGVRHALATGLRMLGETPRERI
jgi:arginyl-tRNA synthetase